MAIAASPTAADAASLSLAVPFRAAELDFHLGLLFDLLAQVAHLQALVAHLQALVADLQALVADLQLLIEDLHAQELENVRPKWMIWTCS